MFPFLRKNQPSTLPEEFILEKDRIPLAEDLNKLLARCREKTHPNRKLATALDKSFFCLSIFNQKNGKLLGFVRATSDHALNANLWNLVAEPGKNQKRLLSILIKRALEILKRDLPGCSISVSSPSIAIEALTEQGFLLDPNGIRAMAYKLK